MLRGDISNKGSIQIAFRLEDVVIKKSKNPKLLSKIKGLILGEISNYEVDPLYQQVINYIYHRTDFTSVLVCDLDYYVNNLTEIRRVLGDLPYSRFYTILKPVEISSLLNVEELLYYVDEDLSRISTINNKACINLQTLNLLIKGGI